RRIREQSDALVEAGEQRFHLRAVYIVRTSTANHIRPRIHFRQTGAECTHGMVVRRQAIAFLEDAPVVEDEYFQLDFRTYLRSSGRNFFECEAARQNHSLHTQRMKEANSAGI